MKVAVLGTGDVGHSLTSAFLKEGVQVIVGTRDPYSKTKEWIESNKNIKYGTFDEAANFGEIIVLAIRGSAVLKALATINKVNLNKKVIVDVTNPLIIGKNGNLELSIGHNSSLSEEIQKSIPDAYVVKALNIVNNQHMYRPNFGSENPEMFYCGDFSAAKQKVKEWLIKFGWNPIDVGDLEMARLLESLSLLGIKIALKNKNWNYIFKLITK